MSEERKHTASCGHVQLLARDAWNQPKAFSNACLICERDALAAQNAELVEALREIESATSDTLRSHPETACCFVTLKSCEKARAILARHTPVGEA